MGAGPQARPAGGAVTKTGGGMDLRNFPVSREGGKRSEDEPALPLLPSPSARDTCSNPAIPKKQFASGEILPHIPADRPSRLHPVKIISRHIFPTALVAAVLLLAGCRAVSVNSFQYVGGPAYAATVPAQVEVLRTLPARPFERLGEISAEPASNDVDNAKIEQALQNAAAKMGANAVVITSDRIEVTGAMVSGPIYGRTVQRTTGRVIVGIAIRFTGK